MTPDEVKKLFIGTEVQYTATARNVTKQTAPNTYERTVEPMPIEPTNGVYIGWRQIPFGKLEYSYDDSPDFRNSGSTLVALVVFSPRRLPVRVLPQHLELLP